MRARPVWLFVVELAAALLARGAAAQPDWLPDEARRPAVAAPPIDPDDPCADRLLAAPLAPPVRDTGFDRVHGACLARLFALRTDVARDRDARRTAGAAAVELRGLFLADLELTLGARAAADQLDDPASTDARDGSFGPIYLGAAAGHATRAFGRPLRLAWGLSLDLPWTRTGMAGPIVAASPQVAAAVRLADRLTAHGRLGALVWLVRPPDDIDTRRALALSSDLVWSPWRYLAAGAGVEAQTGWHGAGLDHLLARGGLRVPLGRARIDLAGAARLAGREPVDLALEVTLAIDR